MAQGDEWRAWIRKVREIPQRDGVRASFVVCNLLAPVWPALQRDDLATCLSCLRDWIACPCERHAKACFERVGRHGFAPLADENFPLPLEVEGVVFSPAAEHAHWAVDEALMAASFPHGRVSGDSLSAASHIERSIAGAVESLRLASPSKIAPHAFVIEKLRAELGIDVEVFAVATNAPVETPRRESPVKTSVDWIGPTMIVNEESVRDLASRLASAFFPNESPTERIVEKQEREAVGYGFYRIVIEWRSKHLSLVWTYQRERNMGVDVDDVLTIDVDGSRARVDERRIEVSRGKHHDALEALLRAWLR